MIFNITFSLITLFFSQTFANDLTVKMILSPAGSFEAKTTKLRGEITKTGNKYTAESIWVKIEDLKTGIDLRDEHFHRHLNAEKNPKVVLSKVVASEGTGSGTLNVNGMANAINFTYKEIGANKIEALFKVKPSMFKLKDAKYFEIGVEDDVEVVASMDVK